MSGDHVVVVDVVVAVDVVNGGGVDGVLRAVCIERGRQVGKKKWMDFTKHEKALYF